MGRETGALALAVETREWLAGEDGRQALERLAERAGAAFLEAGLKERLLRERQASEAGGTKRFRIGNSVRALSGELAALAVAGHFGTAVPDPVWEAVRDAYLPVLFALDSLSFQGLNHNPPWASDLWTADIGANLALAAHFGLPVEGAGETLAAVAGARCLEPILADWVDGATRIHSLDSMGHNWWSVIVGGAGVVAALLGREADARRIAANLIEWFRYPGSDFSRKRPNFGAEGDFVEGFHYAEYALCGPLRFALAFPEFRLVPDALSEAQVAGLCRWLRDGVLATRDGHWPLRFGDVSIHHTPRADVWHPLARLAGDRAALALAHALKPFPADPFELLLWQACPAEAPSPREPGARLYPTSGLALLEGRGATAALRAGECWNHNHLDAGSFIFQQEGVVWADDAGTCTYSLPDYAQYYVTPQAHNVAFAPDLAPPTGRAMYEGTPAIGRFLLSAQSDRLAVALADTNLLSGGALTRSYRWLFLLDGEVLLVWDDLSAYAATSLQSLLHTSCAVEAAGAAGDLLLRRGEQRCRVCAFCDAPVEFSLAPARMGQGSAPRQDDIRHLEGQCLAWRSAPAVRVKFGTAMGTGLVGAEWSHSDAGWECALETAGGPWRVWFNPLADGRVMHQNRIARWQGLETDAYALLTHGAGDAAVLMSIDGSFVRRGAELLFSSLARQALATMAGR